MELMELTGRKIKSTTSIFILKDFIKTWLGLILDEHNI